MKSKVMVLVSILLTSVLAKAGLGMAASQDKPAVHGMLVFGGKSLYFSHLPMFHKPHDYQVVFKAELRNEGLKAYLDDKKLHPEEKIYTFVPEVMSLPEAMKATKTFKGDLYRGHFERGGVVIQQNVKVQVADLLYFARLSADATKPAVAADLLIGDSTEQWLVHLIYAKPDFDQILQVQTQPNFDGSVVVVQLKDVDHASPLKEGQTYQTTKDEKILTVKEQYLEFDDLAM